jgi:Flp pilus assembly protein TadG
MVERLANRVLARVKRLLKVRSFRRLLRREDGGVAIEFAMVALPFFALLMVNIETALVFFAGQTLETAVADSSRLILTRQAQNLNYAGFKTDVCNRIHALFDCANGIQMDVRTINSFSGADLSKPIDANGNLNISPTYQPGTSGQIVVVRVVYKWPIWAQFFGISLSDMAGGYKLLMATAVFRNE